MPLNDWEQAWAVLIQVQRSFRYHFHDSERTGKAPVRRRLHGIETFNVLRGGEYFFMPSMSALNWLATLA